MKPIERVKKVIEYKKLSISGFEKATGMSNNSIQTAIKRNANLKDDTLNSILICFPDISAEWLLTGNGYMLKEENKIEMNLNEPNAAYTKSKPGEDLLLAKIKFQEEQIDWYKKQMEYLTDQLPKKEIPNRKRVENALNKLDEFEEEEIKKLIK